MDRHEEFRCTGCGTPLSQLWKHCIRCGKENPHFDKDHFFDKVGETWEDYRASMCGLSHPNNLTRVRKVGTTQIEDLYPFCSICGTKLISHEH